MLLDNFTMIAQLINFLVLIWLLKRFLYGPLLAAIDAREQRLRAQQQLAKQEQQTALATQQQLLQHQQQLADQQTQLLLETRNQAETERRELIDQARSDIAALRDQWHQRLAAEQQELTTNMRKQTEAAMLQTLNSMLMNLTSRNLQQAAVATFIQRFKTLDEQQKRLLDSDPAGRQEDYQVLTPRPLTAAEKEQLEAAVRRVAGAAQFRYQTDASLLCGIELHHGGHKLSWSLTSHLNRLQQQLATLTSDQGVRP